MKKLILLSIAFMMLAGCAKDGEKNYTIEMVKGVKVYKNMNKPSVKHLDFSPKEVFRIVGLDERNAGTDQEFFWPRALDVDSKGNIFILDTAGSSVKKFDKNGFFVKSFGRLGKGPGEMERPYMLAIINDIVCIADPGGTRMLKFDTDGNFISDFPLIKAFPSLLRAVGKDKFICFLNKYEQTEKGLYRGLHLTLLDSQFREIATLYQYKGLYSPTYNDLLDSVTAFAVGQNKIAVADNSEDHYKINVFDFNGQLLYTITKEYHKVPFPKTELKILNDTLEKTIKKLGSPNYNAIKLKFKKSINSMYYDKKGRLLVAASLKRNETNKNHFLVDVFKDGVFLKKIKLDIARGYDFFKAYDEKIYFKGGRILYANELEAVIKVFQY